MQVCELSDEAVRETSVSPSFVPFRDLEHCALIIPSIFTVVYLKFAIWNTGRVTLLGGRLKRTMEISGMQGEISAHGPETEWDDSV